MKFPISQRDGALYISVPKVSFTGNARDVVQHQISLEDRNPEAVRFELLAWQKKLGTEEWGRDRWELIKEVGTRRFSSKGGGGVTFDPNVGNGRWRVRMNIGGDIKIRYFSVNVFGKEFGEKCANFQLNIWKNKAFLSENILPYDVVDRLLEGRLLELFAKEIKILTTYDGRKLVQF